MRVLVLTAMYPSQKNPTSGTFVQEQVESLRREGADVEVMAFEGARSFRNYLRAGTALRRHLRTNDYDVIHAHYGLVGLPARMQTKCPIVLTYHGSDILGEVGPRGYTAAGRLKVVLCKLLGLLVDERIVVASALRNRMWPSTVIPMGVDMDMFQPADRLESRRQLGLREDRRYVLFVASPSNACKRYDIATAAIASLGDTEPPVELLPVHGVSHDLVPAYMNAGDALILTSDHEASPCVIKEALACNLPIVAVDVGDVRERLAGVDGCHIADRNAEALAEKLTLALAAGRSTVGREKVREVSLEVTARNTMEVLARAARRKRGRASA